MRSSRFVLGCDLRVGQSIVVDGYPYLVTAVEPEVLGIVVAYSGTKSLVIPTDEVVELRG